MKKTLGGERIGSGGKMTFDTKTFNRSTHDLGKIVRTTMSAGTLVPIYVMPTLPGDTHDIKLQAKINTLPTVGPLYGSFKFEIHVFQVVNRQYNRDLQMNKLEIGRDISQVQFPLIELKSNNISLGLQYEYSKETPWGGKEIANCQIEPSTIMNYLGVRGLGQSESFIAKRRFNAIPLLAYWDIYRNYYANKMETDAYVIANSMLTQDQLVGTITLYTENGSTPLTINTPRLGYLLYNTAIKIQFDTYEKYILFQEDEFVAKVEQTIAGNDYVRLYKGNDWIIQRKNDTLEIYFTFKQYFELVETAVLTVYSEIKYDYIRPNVRRFELKNIDTMREILMSKSGLTPFVIDDELDDLEPYTTLLRGRTNAGGYYDITALQCKQEGLALKTYSSDRNNNWLNTEWISGSNGVNEVTSIQVDENGRFTLDEFNIKMKVYDMLNHVLASGGSFDDWQETVYGVERIKQITSPMFEGGLIKEIIFEEVVSQSASNAQGEQALGTLAGRGVLGDKHKGGNLVIKCREHGYIMAIASITPRIDYSQGNAWWADLKNLGEMHNPYMDAIGYQDLITDRLGFFDTPLDEDGIPVYKTAGKQPSWTNYQTEVNEVYGNFALENEQMYQVLNRRYEAEFVTGTGYRIGDLTTYIDPVKFNHIYADTSPDAMNYTVQVSIENECRRVMSYNQIPNI